MSIGRVLRIGAAVALLVTSLVHVDLYFGGYRSAGSVPTFGRMMLIAAIVAAVLAALVAVRREWYVRVAGMLLPAGILAAFAYTHTEHTLLDFSGSGFDPSPQAVIALIAEIAAIVLLAATFIPSVAASDESFGIVPLAGAAAVGAIVVVGSGIYWADHYGGSTTTAASPTSVVIKDFTYTPPDLTVPVGATVTWTNDDGVDHTVSATDRAFTSQALGQGATYETTFTAPGTFTYICAIHPEMAGTVTVTP